LNCGLLFALSGRACLFDLHTETFQEESRACRCAGSYHHPAGQRAHRQARVTAHRVPLGFRESAAVTSPLLPSG